MFQSAARYEHADAQPLDDRFDSPEITDHVLQPLEQKIHQYNVLMHRAQEQRIFIDEEIRLREERRYLAETQFRAAKAKHDEYQYKYRAVSLALYNDAEVGSALPALPRVVEHGPSQSHDYEKLDQGLMQKVPKRGRLQPSQSFTTHQMFYLFVMHGIGSMIISGGINFGLAYRKLLANCDLITESVTQGQMI